MERTDTRVLEIGSVCVCVKRGLGFVSIYVFKKV